MTDMAGKLGCGPLAALVILAFVILFVGGNEAVGFYFTNCEDEDILDCLMSEFLEEEEEPEEGSVVATGVYTYKSFDVTVTANIPLKGGAVTGSVSGTCEGQVKGNYDGKPNGVISGAMTGVCAPFFVNIPAGANYSGSVNKTGKSVPINFTGRGAGITHEGAMVLTYP